MNEICWNCKHFTYTGGHGSSDWGFCFLRNEYKDSESKCEKFLNKKEEKKVTPVKIETVKKEVKPYTVFNVRVYDSSGELMDVKDFGTVHEAGRFAFETEQFYKFYKED